MTEKDDTEKKDIFIPIAMRDGNMLGMRNKDGKLQRSTMQPMHDGDQLDVEEDLVKLDKQKDGTYAVKTLYVGTSSGPSRTATPQYRTGWDSVFGKKKQKKGAAN